jgi:uncharacterized protein (TIGR02147 family)
MRKEGATVKDLNEKIMALNVYEYIDYKKFLSDWREEEKRRNPGLTHEFLCCALGQKNRSFYNDIEKGRKFIGSEVLDRLIKLFGLQSQEGKYFRALVGYGQPATYAEKEFWFEQIVEMNNTPKRLIDKDTFRYFKEWWHSAVRSALDTCDINTNYAALAKKLFNRITQTQAQESIRLLAQLGLIQKSTDGFWKPTEKVVTTGNNVKDECMRRFQLANHEILRQVLEEDKPGTHDSTQLIVSVSQKGLERIINRIRQIRSEIVSIAHKDEEASDRVYQIAVHAYPVSRKD